MMANESIHKHLLSSEIETLVKVEQIIEEIRVAYNIPEELYGNILVSLTEAVNNAIKHGNKLDPSKKIDFSFEYSETEYIFTIIDEGTGFDFENVPDPTHPDNLEKPDGRGIFIMTSLSDKVDFIDQGKAVKIHFNRV